MNRARIRIALVFNKWSYNSMTDKHFVNDENGHNGLKQKWRAKSIYSFFVTESSMFSGQSFQPIPTWLILDTLQDKQTF